MAEHAELLAVTPIDGRYAGKVTELQPILSEYGLTQRRVAVEAAWLEVLGSGVLPDVEPLGDGARDHLRSVAAGFSVEDAQGVKDIEKTTNHDVKAVENWLRGKLGGDPAFADYLQLIHFGATSEDVNNLAYGMQLRDTRDQVVDPHLVKIADALEAKASAHADLPMLGRTHGQPATPTTLGREMRVFSERVLASRQRLGGIAVLGKFNGATGSYNAMHVAYPEVNWPQVSTDFVRSLGFTPNMVTTQIEPHDWIAAMSNEVALGNTVLTDLARDMWLYISQRYLAQEVKAEEVGSSTMPHKVNPIDFENAEGNFGVANAVLTHLAQKLPISRLQRDLSDSTVQRTFGEAFGHTLVGYKSLEKGLGKVYANPEVIAADLDNEWAILAEPVQTVMRRHNVTGAYDIIKAASRGKSWTAEDYHALVESLDIPESSKARLRELTPAAYLGYAPEIARGEHTA